MTFQSMKAVMAFGRKAPVVGAVMVVAAEVGVTVGKVAKGEWEVTYRLPIMDILIRR